MTEEIVVKEEVKEGIMVESKPTNGSKSKENVKFFVTGLIAMVAVVLIVSVSFGVYRVYAKSATDPFTVGVAKVLRLPALKINGTVGRYADYILYLSALNKMDEKSPSGLTAEKMSDLAILRLANNALLDDAARLYGITVTDEEINARLDEIIKNYGTRQAAEAELQKSSGWTIKTFTDHELYYAMLQDKLNEIISTNVEGRAEAQVRANAVVDELKKGGKFEDLAAKYGEDTTAQNGGEIGLISRGDIAVPEFENAAFALKKGEYTVQPVLTAYGFHIIKVDERKTEKVKDANGKMQNMEKVFVRHIMIKIPDLGSYLDKALLKANINLYIGAHNPFADVKAQIKA